MQNFFKKPKHLIALLFFSLSLFSFGIARADSCSDLAKQFQITANGTPINTIGGLPQVCTATGLITSVINIIMSVAALVAVAFLMIGGFWYLTAAGNEEQAEKGRKALTSSIIGLIVIVMSFALVKIAVNLLTANVGSGTPATTTTTSNGGTGSGTTAGNGAGAGTGTGTGTTGTGTAGTPMTTNPASMLFNLTQQDYANYDNSADHLVPGVSFSNITANGLTAMSSVSASDKQSLDQVMAACGASTPPDAQLYKNGQYANVDAQYQGSGTGIWSATLNYTGSVGPSDNFQVYICGHLIPAASPTLPR